MTMHRRFANAVATATWDWIRLVVAAIVSTSTVRCLFALRVNRAIARVNCVERTPRGPIGRRGSRDSASLLIFGAVDLAYWMIEELARMPHNMYI